MTAPLQTSVQSAATAAFAALLHERAIAFTIDDEIEHRVSGLRHIRSQTSQGTYIRVSAIRFELKLPRMTRGLLSLPSVTSDLTVAERRRGLDAAGDTWPDVASALSLSSLPAPTDSLEAA